MYHTNHCLGKVNKSIEVANAISSTTHPRFNLLKEKIETIDSKETLIDLFHSHTNFPKSILAATMKTTPKTRVQHVEVAFLILTTPRYIFGEAVLFMTKTLKTTTL